MTADRPRSPRHLFLIQGIAEADEEAQASPEVPPILTDEIAIGEWQRIAPTLCRQGRLTALQQTLLVGYCLTLAKAKRAEDIVAREGAYYQATARNGATVLKRHPAAVDAERCWSALRQFARQLGIGADCPRPTPASEQRRALFK